MAEERHWIAAVPEETYLNERLYAHDVAPARPRTTG